MEGNQILDPKNVPTWVASTFILALLALGVACIGLYRTSVVMALTQTQLVMLTQEVDALRAQQAGAPAAQKQAQAAVAAPTVTK